MPSIGQFLVLQVTEGTFQGNYHAQIHDIDDHTIFIDIPLNIHNHILEPLPVRTKVTVHFADSQDTPCEFESVVEGNVYRSISLQAIRKPDKQAIRRKQRREFVRVPVSFPVEMVVMDLETRKINNVQGVSQNLSGGGIAVIVRHDQPVKVGDLVGFVFQLNMEGTTHDVVGKARILTITQPKDLPSRKICAMQFVEITDQDRQSIVQYVFRRQIELRERGWLRSGKVKQ